MSSGWWELIFLMFLMKLPIVYLCAVVWWAIKDPPTPEGAAKLAELPETPPRWRPWRLRRGDRRPGPHGSPGRRVPRAPQTQRAYAKHE
jgi:hypothetical protein